MNKTSVIPYNVLSSLPNMDLAFGDTDNPLLIGKRVWCLYRVSTNQQVDHDEKNEADIPMQRKACHRFAEKMGWTIIHEEQEEGISGHKVRAENRDKLQLIKTAAKQKKFDILLVFMFDRIGRIADETPFVVEWFVKNGIQVWSVKASNALTAIRTNSPTISVFGRQTARVKRPLSARQPAWGKL